MTNPVFPFPEDIAHLSDNPNLWRDLTLGLTGLGVKVVERIQKILGATPCGRCAPAGVRKINFGYFLPQAWGKKYPNKLDDHGGSAAFDDRRREDGLKLILAEGFDFQQALGDGVELIAVGGQDLAGLLVGFVNQAAHLHVNLR